METLRYWIPLAIVTTMLAGLIYVAVQQDMRTGANDPQVQIAEDVSAALTAGEDPTRLSPSIATDISQSLAPFIIVFDDSGKMLFSTAELHGTSPTPPPGVFAYTKTHGEERLSWQPEPSVRIATVIMHYGGTNPGFVLAGRSLQEVEKREAALTLQIMVGWVATLLISLVFVAMTNLFGHRSENQKDILPRIEI